MKLSWQFLRILHFCHDNPKFNEEKRSNATTELTPQYATHDHIAEQSKDHV